MVFPDISENKINVNRNVSHSTTPSAPAALLDRFFAFVIDYLVTSPFVLFALYIVYNNGFQYWRSHPQAPENSLFVVIAAISYVLFFSFIQSLFVAFWHATPGQYFLKVRLQFHESERFIFFRAFTRQVSFWFSFLLLGIPFLSVMTNRQRRTFYDRLSDVTVVTRKEEQVFLGFEKEYVYWQSFTVTLSLFVGFLFSAWVWNNYEKIVQRAGSFAALDEQSYFCETLKGIPLPERLSTAIGLNLVEQLSDDCLNREADFVFWKYKKGDYSLAYYAKSLTTANTDKQKQYREQACRGELRAEAADYEQFSLGCRAAMSFFSPSSVADTTANTEDSGTESVSSDTRAELYDSLKGDSFLEAALRYELGKQLQKDADLGANFAAIVRHNGLRAVKKFQISEMLTRMQQQESRRAPASVEGHTDDMPESRPSRDESAEAEILRLLGEL